MKEVFRSIATTLCAVALTTAAGTTAWAKPQLDVNVTATRTVIETIKGVKVTKNVPAQSAVSGDTLTFSLAYKNIGNETATNAVINNPISSGMSYIDNSASGKGSVITFSIDGGKTYKKPSLLSYEIKQPGGASERHTARPEEYTHIQWLLKSVPPNSSGTLEFKARVK